MRVLFVSQLLPYPLDTGSKVRNYYLLRHLSRRHEITLVSFIRRDEERALAEELRPFCEAVHTVPLRRSRARDAWHMARSLTMGVPLLVARDASPVMGRLVRRLNQERPFDVVQVSPLTMAPYALAFSGPRRVVDFHDVMTSLTRRLAQVLPLWLRPLARLEALRLSRYEPGIVRRLDHALTVTEADRRELVRLGAPLERLSVVPIGVDSEVPPVRKRNAGRAILHLGWLGYPPNLDGLRWFVQQVFPRVAAQLGDCTLYVVGGDPPADVVQAGLRDPRIVVAGRVPDVTPYLEKASALVVPLRSGSGMRVKILEAFARRVPVVSTTLGYEGIEASPDTHLLAGDEPEAFADAVVRLARDELLARRLTKGARRLVKAKYDWRSVGEALDTVYEGLSVARLSPRALPSGAEIAS